MAATRISDADRANLGTLLPGWTPALDRDAIRREFKFANFSEAWAFMSRVALLAEKLDHAASEVKQVVPVARAMEYDGQRVQIEVRDSEWTVAPEA